MSLGLESDKHRSFTELATCKLYIYAGLAPIVLWINRKSHKASFIAARFASITSNGKHQNVNYQYCIVSYQEKLSDQTMYVTLLNYIAVCVYNKVTVKKTATVFLCAVSLR